LIIYIHRLKASPFITEDPIETKRHSIRQQLRTALLQDRDPHVHPTEDHGKVVYKRQTLFHLFNYILWLVIQPVRVKIGMAVIHFTIDEFRSIMAVDSWMRIAWKDEHLSWDPVEYENLTQIHFSLEELWKPDIHLYNK